MIDFRPVFCFFTENLILKKIQNVLDFRKAGDIKYVGCCDKVRKLASQKVIKTEKQEVTKSEIQKFRK